MSIERIHELQKLYPRGRRVKVLPKTDAVRAKIPGVTEGVICSVVPRPSKTEAPDQESPPLERYGVQVEYKRSDGTIDHIILDLDDIDVLPHDSS